MISAEYMDYLKVLHGSFNAIVVFLFLYQGSLGLRIRKERKSGGQRNVMVIKRPGPSCQKEDWHAPISILRSSRAV